MAAILTFFLRLLVFYLIFRLITLIGGKLWTLLSSPSSKNHRPFGNFERRHSQNSKSQTFNAEFKTIKDD
jgi:hypothetical protein